MEYDVKRYKEAAEQGDAKSQCILGNMYSEGEGVELDYGEAAKWYKKSAEQGNVQAQCNLGFMYCFGLGVSEDHSESVKWYKKATEQGDINALRILGKMYERGQVVEQDYAEAAKWYQKLAEIGDIQAQFNLASMYYKGNGVEQDYAEAAKWYTKSAEQGFVQAQSALANMYYGGKGVVQDYAESVKWYKKAAEQGDINALCILEMMYKSGHVVEQDYAESVKSYEKTVKRNLETKPKKAPFKDPYIGTFSKEGDPRFASVKKIVLDTETTGLSPSKNTIVQLSIIDGNNVTLFNEYFKPSKEHYSGALFDSWMQASNITGITPEKVENSHSIDFYREKIQSILDNADEILIYNAKFDVGFMKSHGFTFKPTTTITDVMLEYSNYKKVINPKYGDYKWFKLVEAASEFNYDFGAHDSLEDVKATLFVHNEIEKPKSSLAHESDLEHELEQLKFTNFKKLTLLLKERETLSRETLINRYETLRNEINQVVTKYHSNNMGVLLSNYNFNPVIDATDFSLLENEYISYQVIQLEKIKQKLKISSYIVLNKRKVEYLNSSFNNFYPAGTQEEWLKEKDEIYQVKKYEWSYEKRLLKETGLSRLDLIKICREAQEDSYYYERYGANMPSGRETEKITDKYDSLFLFIMDEEEFMDEFEFFTMKADIYDLLINSLQYLNYCENSDKSSESEVKLLKAIGAREYATEVEQDSYSNKNKYCSLFPYIKPKMSKLINELAPVAKRSSYRDLSLENKQENHNLEFIEKSNENSKDNTKNNFAGCSGCLIWLIIGLIVVVVIFA